MIKHYSLPKPHYNYLCDVVVVVVVGCPPMIQVESLRRYPVPIVGLASGWFRSLVPYWAVPTISILCLL
jgi:hypothetical protein